MTWAGQLLTLAAWMQVAVLSAYDKRAVHRAAHSAVVRGLSTSIRNHNQPVRHLYTIGPHLPKLRCCIITCTLQWPRAHVF